MYDYHDFRLIVILMTLNDHKAGDVTEPVESCFHQIRISQLTFVWIRLQLRIYRTDSVG